MSLSTADKLAADQLKGKAIVAFALAASLPAIAVYHLNPTFKGLVVLIVFAVMIAVSLGTWLQKNLMKPVKMLAVRLERLSLEQHDVDIPFMNRKDEVGDMARSIDILKEIVLDLSPGTNRLGANIKPYQTTPAYARDEAVKVFADKLTENVLAFGRDLTRNSDSIAKLAQEQANVAHQVSVHSETIDRAANQNMKNLEELRHLADDLHKAIAKSAVRSAEVETALEQASASSHQTDVKAQGLLDMANRMQVLSETMQAFGLSDPAIARAANDINQQVENIRRATVDTVSGIQDTIAFIQDFAKYAKQVTKSIQKQEAHCKNIMTTLQMVGQTNKDIYYSLNGIKSMSVEVKSYGDEIHQRANNLSGQSSSMKIHFDKLDTMLS